MPEIQEYDEKMKKTQKFLMEQFDAVRAGRANAAVLNGISVNYYGSPTPIHQVAAISTPDARTLLVTPWDRSVLSEIEKAIQISDLGIHPQNDGHAIRLNFPQLTEERRKELAKQVRKYGEEAKVAIRNIRRDAMEMIKRQQKAGDITEDDQRDMEKELQKLTDANIKDIDKLTEDKEKELFSL